MTYRDLVRNAALELNIVNAEDALEAADAVFIESKLNRIFDRWNARGLAAYTTLFTTYTLTPNLQPHTLGPSGTYTVATRPERLLGATLVYSSSSRVPLRERDEQWWLRQSNRTMAGIPSDVFYRPAWPNGEIYLWPVPSGANQIEVATAQPFVTNGNLNTTFSLPPGFEDALTLTLAEEIAPAFAAQPSPILMGKAADARLILFSNHGKRYPLGSDFGGGRGWWDYRTGMDR